MSVSNPNLSVSRQDLADFYDKIFPYLGGKAAAGFTPVGTIISVMGVNAPANYLKCDGTVYNISDYPELARYFGQQFSMVNKFGGNGTSTFAVPDLRGEFLRGTGTNSHTNQGNGANVGVHQDGTGIPALGAGSNGTDIFIRSNSQINSTAHVNGDKVYKRNAEGTLTNNKATGVASTTGEYFDTVTVRPTNTSVLFCIATKNIYLDPKNDYSTEEKVVGTWIDGKPIYQKTFEFDVSTYTDADARRSFVLASVSNVDCIVSSVDVFYRMNGAGSKIIGTTMRAGNTVTPQYTTYGTVNTSYEGKIYMQVPADMSITRIDGTATIQYTKTTD